MKKELISILILILTNYLLYGQLNYVEDYYHASAQSYINEKYQESENIIYDGLKRFPNDPTLEGILKKIKEKKPPEDQNNDNEQTDQNQDKKDQEQPQPQEQEMTKEEAERMLQAIENDEKDLQKKLKKVKAQKSSIEKDW